MMEEYLIKLDNIVKKFPGVVALNNVQLHIEKGEIHAIIGENGAGKSTLIKILCGIYKNDGGTIEYKGTCCSFNGPMDAIKAGITVVPQEPSFFPHLTVCENIFMGRHLKKKSVIDRKKMYEDASALFKKLGEDINPQMLAKYMSAAQKQLTLVAKAMYFDADVIIFDEPTAALTDKEAENLFNIINQLKDLGKTIIYISHRLDEIIKLSNSTTILRDGKYVGTFLTKDLTKKDMINHMLGHSIEKQYPDRTATPKEVVLSVQNLTRKNEFKNVSFEVRAGEIFGIYGLLGSGRSEVAETIFGLRHKDAGEIFLNQKPITVKDPQDAIGKGIGMLTEDRRERGILPILSISKNFAITNLKKYSKSVFNVINRKNIEKDFREYINIFHVRAESSSQPIKFLSGGNQQKVIIAKWLNCQPQLLILDEPTKGIDVAAKAEIYEHLNMLSARGLAIVLISSEIEEVMGMSDRIMVLAEGRPTGLLDKKDFNSNSILTYAHSF
jgi:ABC-type sugar transport system ATPase subunit